MLCKNCQTKPISYHGTMFCSSSCAAIYNNKKYPKKTKNKKIIKCGYCNNIILYNRRKFCSKQCLTKYKTIPNQIKQAKNRAYQSKWRSKKYKVLAPDANPKKIYEIYKNCPKGYEVDHIIPLSKGGLHHENNLQYLPKNENRKKGNKLLSS